MADNETPNAPTGETNETPDDTTANGEQTPAVVTAADLERFRNSMFADMRRFIEGKIPKAQARKPKESENSAANDDTTSGPDPTDLVFAMQDALDGRNLSPKQRAKLRADFRDAYARGDVSDPTAWVDSYLDIWAPPNKSQPGNEAAPPVSDQGPPPVSNRGAPSMSKDYETVIDPNELTGDDIRRMVQKFGKANAYRKVREMAERHYRDRSLVIPE